MANGRQRKRDVLLAKKAAERNAKLGLAGLSTEGLTSIVSDDSNDLDNVSFSTTDGANVTIKNNRVKDSTPSVNVLGGRKGYKPGGSSGFSMDDELVFSDGPTSRASLGGRKGYMPGSSGASGPISRGSKGSFNFMDDEMLLSSGPSVRGSRKQKQAKAITEFVGEDLSDAPTQTHTVAMDSADDLALQQDDRVISEEINDNGTVTYTLAADNMGDPEVTTTELTEAQKEPGLYENIVPGFERALTPTADNTAQTQAIMHQPSDEEKAAAAITMEEQLKEQELMRQLEAETRASNALLGDDSNTITGTGSLQNQSVGVLEDGSLPTMHGDVPGYEGVKEDGRKGYMPGGNTGMTDEELEMLLPGSGGSTRGSRKGYTPGVSSGGSTRGTKGNRLGGRKGYEPGDDNTIQAAMQDVPGYGFEPEAELIDEMDGYSEVAPTTPSTVTDPNIHENEPGTTPPEVIVEEAKNAENDIQAAQAGNPHLGEIAAEAKTEVEKVKEEVENGTTSVDEAKDKIKNSLGQLGELLGIDGKDLIRGLFRYAGARIFGMSGNEAGRFAYEGFMTDEAAEAKVEAAKLENMGLGAGATAQQKNLKAYKEEIKRINNDKTLSKEEKAAAIKTANEVFGVNEPTSMGRPVNIKGIRADGSEEIVVGRRNDNNSYDVFMNDQWVPIELSGLSDVQVTGRNTDQYFEKGYTDPRNGVSIDNAMYVDAGGQPIFNVKGEQAKRHQMAERAVNNYPIVDQMMKDPEMRENVTSAMGGLKTWAAGNANAKVSAAIINNALGDSIPQRYRSATQAWLQALLRADTGAAYTGTEIMDYIATNIPQVGDTEDTVNFKIAQMKSTTTALVAASGPGSKYFLGRLDGSIEPPEHIKALQAAAMTGTSAGAGTDDSGRSAELEAALAQY